MTKGEFFSSKKIKIASIIICAMIFITLFVLYIVNPGNYSIIKIGKTAVITEDVHAFVDPDMTTEHPALFKNGDLVYVVESYRDNILYIKSAPTEVPIIEGFIPKSSCTYEFDSANQGVLNTHIVYTNKERTKLYDASLIKKGKSLCIINYIEDEWANISLPGGIDGLWVKSSEIIYDLKMYN